MPRFACFFETLGQPVSAADAAWSARLPLSRQAVAGEPPARAEHAPSVGDYFTAVRAYIEGPGAEAVGRALAASGTPDGQVAEFRLLLAKHGAYYHPCRIVAAGRGRKVVELVLNVAVSPAGLDLAPREFDLLQRLHREFTPAYVPEVHGFGQVEIGRGATACMFLGQWLAGFHEFHLTGGGPEGEPAIVVWDPEYGHRFPDPAQSARIYTQAARILTHYFNFETLECIGAWHHAAGDFVVRLSGPRPELRLVSVREYRPILTGRGAPRTAAGTAERPGGDVQTLLEALMVFFLSLSVRMRLDRLDGVGELAWSGPAAVAATLEGVLQALSAKPPPSFLPLPLDLLFKHFLLSASRESLSELCAAILADATRPPPGPGLVGDRLDGHVAALTQAIGGL